MNDVLHANQSGLDPFRALTDDEARSVQIARGLLAPDLPTASMCPISFKLAEEDANAIIPV